MSINLLIENRKTELYYYAFILLYIIILVISFFFLVEKIMSFCVTNRKEKGLLSFKVKNYPYFYSEFGKFPTEYLNTNFTDKNNPDGKIMNLKLRDFYIASAFRPYQVAGQTYDICSYKSIQFTIEKGARFHFIDVWASNPTNPFDETAYPIVRNETLMPGKTGEALIFDKVCEIYKKHSWVGTSYPLILYLNIRFTAEKNKFVLEKIAESLWKNFKGRFAGIKYSFGRENIGDISIKEAMNKIIILTNIHPKEGHLQELVNGVISTDIQNSGSLTVYDKLNVSYGGILAKSSNMQSVIDFNKTNIGIVIPGDVRNITNIIQPGIDLIQIPLLLDKNKKLCDRNEENTQPGFKDNSVLNFGYNFICMNYQKPGKEREEYMDFFRKSSLVLKCDNLRYIPSPAPVIEKQNEKASFAPRNMNFMDGYFSHNF